MIEDVTAEDLNLHIEVLPYRPYDLMSRKQVDGNQYQIKINGRLSGFLPYFDGAKILLHERRSPMELRAIENAVRRKVIPQRIGGIAQPGLPPKNTGQTRALNAEDFA